MRVPLAAAGIVLFVVLATLNAGGYRYGASDQAFYIPAIERHLDPALFPRDWPMLAAQDRLNAFTPAAARAASATQTSLPSLFLALYLTGLVTLATAALVMARNLYRSGWTAAALLAALTLRHAVALGAVNTLEGYMHPRTIAFALGALAVALFLEKRDAAAAGLVVLAGILHPTTAIWFAMWLGVAAYTAVPAWRRVLLGLGFAVALAAGWALAGPMAGRLVVMDDAWVAALAAKTYLFPDRWPSWAWATAGLTAMVPAAVYAMRVRRGLAPPRENGLAAGVAALALVFLASLPFSAARVAFAVQLQVPRVLWMLDYAAIVYLVWLLAEGGSPAREGRPSRRAVLVAVVLAAAALGRGTWVMLVEHPERRPVEIALAPTDWNRALEWVRAQTPPGTHVLADPGHAWRYGTSVRVAASRDVWLEEAKDGAFALYSREAATRFVERVGATQGFAEFGEEELKRLAARWDVDLLVTERTVNLPLLHASGRFRVYSLEPSS